MQLNDANNSGNVHGGNILRLIEDAGFIVATRHCNKYDKEVCMQCTGCFTKLGHCSNIHLAF